MSFVQALLLSLMYVSWNARPLWLFGAVSQICYFTGWCVGIILGDPVKGTMIGAAIQLINLGWTAYGNVFASDINLATIVCAALGIVGGLETEACVALSVPVGAVGNIMPQIQKNVNSAVWGPFVDKQCEKLNFTMIDLASTVFPFLLMSLIICPWFIPMLLYGTDAVVSLVNSFPGWLLTCLKAMGALLPALGMGNYLNVVGTPKTVPFFVIGFFLMEIFNLSIFGIAVIGFLLAYAGAYFDPNSPFFN